MWQDLRVAARFLWRRPGSTVLAILTLGVAIAVSTVAVGAIDSALWRSLPADRGADLVTIHDARPTPPHFQALSYADYLATRDAIGDRAHLAAFVRIEQTLGGGDWPERVGGELVSGNYFDVLGARPQIGRVLSSGDDRGSTQPIVVLSEGLWRRRFGADPGIVGAPVRLGQQTFTVVGVAQRGFRGPAWPTEFWLPLSSSRTILGADFLSRPDVPLFQTVGRRLGATTTQLQARLSGLETHARTGGWQLTVLPGSHLRFWPAYRDAVARYFGLFAGLAASILLIACANLGALLLSRAAERQREIAVRQAIGATHLQLVRRLVAESVLLAAGGVVAAALMMSWVASAIALIPMPVPVRLGVTPDLRLALIGTAVAFLATIIFTGLSAGRALRTDVRQLMTPTASRIAAQRWLVLAQVTISCIVLTVAGLLARSAWNIERVGPGFETTNVVLGRVLLTGQGYNAEQGQAFYRQLQDRLASHPDVSSVALGWHAPISQMRVMTKFTSSQSKGEQTTRYNAVSDGYFAMLGVRVIAGREFEARDKSDGEPVAIVNRILADRLGAGALDATIRMSNEPAPRRIIGVVDAIKYNNVTEPPTPFVYLPLAQSFRPDIEVHLGTSSAAADNILRTELRALNPHVALADVRTLADQLSQTRSVPRTSAILSSAGAAVAVFLALVGVYGVLMTSVDLRRRELAIRAALGATPGGLVTNVMREGVGMACIGVTLGTLVSLQTGQLISHQLFGVAARDTLVMLAAPIVVLIASLIAAYAPSRAAGRVDPVTALRSQ